MDPASMMLLFFLFQATEKAIGYAGGKIADSMTKPIWDALEEKAKWLSGKSDTTKRWEAFSQAFAEARVKLETDGRHPEVVKQVVRVLEKFDVTDPSDTDWLNDLSMQLEKASLVSEKPDEFLLVELFSRVLSNQNIQISRAELSETISDFVSIFQDSLFAQSAYQETMFKRSQWQALRRPRYDTRERYISQIIEHNENLDFVGIPELKDRQALRIEDVFISLQTQIDDVDEYSAKQSAKDLRGRNVRAHRRELKEKPLRGLSTNQALTKSQNIVILGDPGAGKTTLLKYIILAFAENRGDKVGLEEVRLPIFIRLYDYVSKREECGKDGFSFADYMYKYCTDHLQLHLSPEFFEQALERGECCVCFDGLDELGTAGLRREITSAVSAMANRYSRNRFIVTSRIVGYEEAPLNRTEFAHHIVQPLSDDDIKSFVEKWYKARERDAVIRRERTEHLVKTIMDETRIKSLASNPLMLTIIALVHRIEAELPHERVKLYDKCVTTLVETWDKVRGIKVNLRRRLLEKLAFWMHNQPGESGRTREVREGNLRLQLTQFLQSDPKLQLDEDQIQKEVENFIDLVKTRSGLLVERGEDVYTFSHLTFQEYLASCDIEKRFAHSTDAIWAQIQPKLHDAHWREVILLLLGSLNRFEQHNPVLVLRIYESVDEFEPILYRHLFLIARALLDHVEIDMQLRDQVIRRLLKIVEADEFSSEMAVELSGSLLPNNLIEDELGKIARNPLITLRLRVKILVLLGHMGQEDFVVKQFNEIIYNSDVREYDRVFVIKSFCEFSPSSASAQLLVDVIEGVHFETRVRRYALMQLVNIKLIYPSFPLKEFLMKIACDSGEDFEVRVFAAGALVDFDEEESVVAVLAEIKQKTNNSSILYDVAEVFTDLQHHEVANGIYLTIAEDDEAEVGYRLNSIRELNLTNPEKISEDFLRFLRVYSAKTDDDIIYQQYAEFILGKLGFIDEGGEKLKKWLDDKYSSSIFCNSINFLMELGLDNDLDLSRLTDIAKYEQDKYTKTLACHILSAFLEVK